MIDIDPRIVQFDHEWKHGDRALAKEIAVEYVNERYDELKGELEKRTLPDLVELTSAYRNAGQTVNRVIVDMWLLAKYDPQQITGRADIGADAVVEAAMEALRRGRR